MNFIRTTFVSMLLVPLALPIYADAYRDIVTVSPTTTLNDRSLCYHAGTSTIGCDTTAPFLDASGNISISGYVSATAYYGDGSNLTGISSGASYLASMTDVDATSPATGSILRYDGTSWTTVADLSTAVSTTTMMSGWPDAIKCTKGSATRIMVHRGQTSSSPYYHRYQMAGYDNYYISFYVAGTYHAHGNMSSYDCLSKSITTLYSEGSAFNFLGNNGTQISLTAIADVSATVPSNGQALVWNNTSGRWEPGSAGGSDNLGDHTATQVIQLGSYQISGDGDSEGISVDSSGVVSLTSSLKLGDTATSCSSSNHGEIKFNKSIGAFQICIP